MSVVSEGYDIRPFLNVDGLVRRLQLNERTVRTMLQTGEIPSYKIRGQWRVDPDDLDRWILSQRSRPA